ncbi:aspartyl-phosphate phosphatase Spo0E family protein [Clostridiaceae bacterium 35-E11]
MQKLQEINNQITQLRHKMHELINKKGDLLHPEVIYISQTLDHVLNQYHQII